MSETEQAYAEVKCASCGKGSAVFPLPEGEKLVNWFNPDWKAELTCPLCQAKHTYTSADLTASKGPVSGPSPR